MRKKVLFLDRDGTIVTEPEDYQLDELGKLQFLPGVFKYLSKLIEAYDFELVMISLVILYIILLFVKCLPMLKIKKYTEG